MILPKIIKKPLLIIPTYNEADNVVSLIPLIFSASPNIEICFVDDNSQDQTRANIRALMAAYPYKIHLIERADKLGLGTAYVTAFKWGLARGYDVLMEMDADHSHNPSDVPRMLEALENHDVVICSRYVPGGGTKNWSFIRKLISRFGSFYGRMVLNVSIRDLTGGFNGWHRYVLEKMNPDSIASEGYTFQIELKYRAKLDHFNILEIPIIFEERRAGKSKMSSKIVFEAMWRLWDLRKKYGR